MKVFLCQSRAAGEYLAISIPFAQFVLAAYIEDIAEVRVSGWTSVGVLPTNEQVLKQIDEFQPDVVGISIPFSITITTAVELARKIKSKYPDTIIAAGGHAATFIAEYLLKTNFIDIVFLGEGEISFREYIEKGDVNKVPGVMFKADNGIIKTGNTPLIDLNTLKPPAYHLLPKNTFRMVTGVESSRGCPYNCEFCETRNFFNSGRIRRMSPEHFVSIIKHFVNSGIRIFVNMDDNFTFNMRGHLKKICELLIQEDMGININMTGRLDDFVENMDMIPLMQKAGCKQIGVGIEAIFDETLKAMKKNARYGEKEIRQLMKAFKDHDLHVFASLIFGYPNETPDMIKKTIDFIISLDVEAMNWGYITPLPGSALYQKASANGEIIDLNFDNYDYMHPVLSTIPKTTIETLRPQTKRYFLRPDFISATFEKLLTGNMKMNDAIRANVLISNVGGELRCRPDTAKEWKLWMDGLIPVLNKLYVQSSTSYNAIVEFKIDNYSLFFKVENSKLIAVSDQYQPADSTIATDSETFTEMWVWFSKDIFSASVLGDLVFERNVEIGECMKSLVWANSIQNALRWGLIREKVPVLKHELREWNALHPEACSNRFNDEKVFIGNTEVGGITIIFGSHDIKDVIYTPKEPRDITIEYTVDNGKFRTIMFGGMESLKELLMSNEFSRTRNKSKELIQPKEFFNKLPLKFLPENAGGLSVLVQYKIDSGSQEDSWWLRIKDNAVKVEEGIAVEKPTLTIRVTKESMIDLINGREEPFQLISKGKIMIEGSPMIMAEVGKCFK